MSSTHGETRIDSGRPASQRRPPLRWSHGLVADLKQRAALGYPHEVCGLLIGRETPEGTLVSRLTEARNLETARLEDRYTLDPEDFLSADAAARGDGLDVVGIWHTHPDHPPKPSQTDLGAAWEGYSYVILSVGRDGVAGIRSWRLAGSEFAEQRIEEAR
jgi:proteasome lid subunit RPN8/RPN11